MEDSSWIVILCIVLVDQEAEAQTRGHSIRDVSIRKSVTILSVHLTIYMHRVETRGQECKDAGILWVGTIHNILDKVRMDILG